MNFDLDRGQSAPSFPGASLRPAGVEFIDENGGGPGVRLRKPPSITVAFSFDF